MFLYDLFVLILSSIYFLSPHKLTIPIKCLSIVLISFVGIFSLYLKDNYKIREFNITKKNLYKLFEGVVFAHCISFILLLFFLSWNETVKFVLTNICVIYFLLAAYRACFHFYLFKIKKPTNILIIGTGREAKLIADEIVNKYALKMKVIGFFSDSYTDGEIVKGENYKIFDNNSDIRQIIEDNKVEIVIVAIKRRMEDELLSRMIFGIPRRVKLYKMTDFYELVTGKYYINRMSINHLFYDFMNKRSVLYSFCKRAFDIVAALIILTVMFPVLLYIAVRVKLTDGGSPIYTQNRIGRNGKPFKCYKLRTMYVNDYVPKDVKEGGYAENQDKDDRVIPFCRFVRKARFDEIPQMINILKGEMSIVGPRTEWEDLVKIYSKEIPYYTCRQWVKTGWTGWAQINQGHCISNDDISEKLQYDLFYLKHRNIFWEISILVKAVFLALGGRHD